MNPILKKALANADAESLDNLTISEIEEVVDEDVMHEAFDTFLQEKIVPVLAEIKQRADDDPDHADVREAFGDRDPDEQQEIFDEAVYELVEIGMLIRTDPKQAAERIRGVLRDPFTLEALMLIFDHPEHIDPEYGEQLKTFVAEHAHWIGVAIAPEMYAPEEVREVAEQLNLDIVVPGDDDLDDLAERPG